MAFNTQITISGPGSCINFEVEVIRKALEAVGCVVTVKNEYPFEYHPNHGNVPKTIEEFIEMISKDNHNKDRGYTHDVSIIADHQPWGG